MILCLHTGIDLDKKKAQIWRLNVWHVKVCHLPTTQLEFKPFLLHHLISHQAVLSAASLPFPTHAGQLAMMPPSSSTLFARVPATLLYPLTLTLAGRQTWATQLPSPLKQLGSVFFSPSLTGAGQRRPRHHGPPSCSRPHASPHARTSTSPAAQVSPLRAHKPPLCRHLKTFR